MSKYFRDYENQNLDDQFDGETSSLTQEKDGVSVEDEVEENAGNKIEKSIADATSEIDTFISITNKQKRSKKVLLWFVCATVICVFAIAILFLLPSNNGLIAVDDIEQKLNESFCEIFDINSCDVDFVNEFKINIDEASASGTFSCWIGDTVIITGVIRDGYVIDMQTIHTFPEEEYYNIMDSEEEEGLLALLSFSVNIFNKDVDTVEKLSDFIANMEMVDYYMGKKMADTDLEGVRTVIDDIEYSGLAGVYNGTARIFFNVRYLPAFSNGFFDGIG